MDLRHAAATDVGRVREHNEDRCLADADLGLFAVADGMGGRAAGEIAATLATDTLRAELAARRAAFDALADDGRRAAQEGVALLCEAFAAASAAVHAAATASEDRRGMGTTLSVLLLAGRRAFVAHVGDSRVYLVRDGAAVQVTRDHTLVDELVRQGHVSAEDACAPELQRFRNVLARAVGVGGDVVIDALDFEVLAGDSFVLCSDGLSHYVDEREIAEIAALGPEQASRRLVDVACERGGHDNVTVVVASVAGASEEDRERAVEFRRNASALAQIPVLATLDARQSMLVAMTAEGHVAEEGAVICREDSVTQGLHVVLDGRVRLVRDGAAARELGPGEWFGDASLVDRWVRAPGAVAASPARLVRISREALLSVSHREPEIGVRVLQAFARGITAGVRPAEERGGAAHGREGDAPGTDSTEAAAATGASDAAAPSAPRS